MNIFFSYVETTGECVIPHRPDNTVSLTYTERKEMPQQSVPEAKFYIYPAATIATSMSNIVYLFLPCEKYVMNRGLNFATGFLALNIIPSLETHPFSLRPLYLFNWIGT